MRKFIIYFIAYYIFSSSQIFSEESGWFDFDKYQSQRLKIKNLSSLAVTQDHSKFYSYHSDDKILVWNFLSVKLIDSVILKEIPQLFFFSRDGKTAITSNYSFHNNQTIRIIDLVDKKLITIDTINMKETFKMVDFKYNSIMNFDYLFDFDTEDSLLIIKNQSQYGGTYGGGDLHWGNSGFLGFCQLINGELKFKSQVSSLRVFDYNRTDNITYFCYDEDFWNDENRSYTNYGLASIIDNDSSYSILKAYNINFKMSNEYKFLRVFFNLKNNILLFKSDSKVQYFDLNQMSIISGKSIVSLSGLLQYDQERNILITNDYGYFYYFDVSIANVMDSIVSPIITNGFIISNEPSIIAYNYDGEIIKIHYDNLNTISTQTTNTFNYFISPNPASDYIIIQPSVGLKHTEGYKAQIFDILGIEVMSESIHPMTQSHRMNIERLTAGVYYIKICDRVEKFVKM